MWNRLRVVWHTLLDSLWFVPTVMTAGAAALAIAMIELSAAVDREALTAYPRIFGAGADGSRSMLSTIAGAMMTVAGVTFSITVVAVTQASSQYTPRILRNFMRDRPSQLTLGTLTGVFVYCLVVIRTIRGADERTFVPALAVLLAFLLGIVAIGMLIFFIHHIAGALQASEILTRVGADAVDAIERLFPDDVGREATAPSAAEAQVPGDAAWHVVPARKSGYLAGVDADGLLAFATKHEVIVRMDRGVGEFVVAGTPLASVTGRAPGDGEAAALCRLFTISSYRTVAQDAAFGVRQMVDMALRALSPGVNDTTTAVMCVHHLTAVLVRLANRRIENRYRVCDGRLCVIARGSTFDELVADAVNEIRRSAAGNVTVLVKLLRGLATVSACTRNARRREVLLAHATLVRETGERTISMPGDRIEVEEAFACVRRAAPAEACVGSDDRHP